MRGSRELRDNTRLQESLEDAARDLGILLVLYQHPKWFTSL